MLILTKMNDGVDTDDDADRNDVNVDADADSVRNFGNIDAGHLPVQVGLPGGGGRLA